MDGQRPVFPMAKPKSKPRKASPKAVSKPRVAKKGQPYVSEYGFLIRPNYMG
jgi:hypothetical protein